MNNDIKKKRGNTMLISSISSYSQNNLPKQNITRNKNINFESTYIKPQGPKFKTKHIEEVYNKMYKYFNIVTSFSVSLIQEPVIEDTISFLTGKRLYSLNFKHSL